MFLRRGFAFFLNKGGHLFENNIFILLGCSRF